MLVNFKNLCSNDVDDVQSKKEERVSLHICDQVVSIFLDKYEVNKKDVWLVYVENEGRRDAKLHFIDKEKAESLYLVLVASLAAKTEYLEIDAIEYGAI